MEPIKTDTQFIVKQIRRGTDLLWKEDVCLKKRELVTDLINYDALLMAIMDGTISEDDYYVLKHLYFLGVCNLHSLKAYIANKEKEEQRKFPEGFYLSMEKRLGKLCRYGLAASFAYKKICDNDGDTDLRGVFYFVSYEGWKAVTTHFLLPSVYGYDSSLLYQNSTEIFGRVAAKVVATSFAYTKYPTDIKAELFSPVTSSSQSASGKAKFEIKDKLLGNVVVDLGSKKQRYIIEPIFFSYDPKILSEKNVLLRIKDRVKYVRKNLEQSAVQYDDNRIIFVVENMDGFKKFADMVSESEDYEFFVENCYFTCDAVIEHGLWSDVNNSMLKLVVNGEKLGYLKRQLF